MTTKNKTQTRRAAGLTYLLTRKKVKNLNLRLQKDGSIHVSAPPHLPAAVVDDFVARHQDFVEKARLRLAIKETEPRTELPSAGAWLTVGGMPRRVIYETGRRAAWQLGDDTLILTCPDPINEAAQKKLFDRFLKEYAAIFLTPRTAACLPLFAPEPDKMPTLRFRTMKSKWGVCRPQRGEITFNTCLIFLPPRLVDYVICHELAHFAHPDHSPAFWTHLGRIMPDCKTRRRALRDTQPPFT